MPEREAKTIGDLISLFRDFCVVPILDGNKVYLAMKPTKEWEPTESDRNQIAVRQRSVLEPDTFPSTAHNAIIDLVFNPQFMRCSTVGWQVTSFYGHDGGSFPPPFMRGPNRKPSYQWGMTGITKKANELFTIHFLNPDKAKAFIGAVSNGQSYTNVEEYQPVVGSMEE